MKHLGHFLFVLTILIAASCRNDAVTITRQYDINNAGFQRVFYELETPPGMILIEGGVYSFSRSDGSVVTDSIHHFYISETEETNEQYLAYLDWLKKRFSYHTYAKALPDTTVWLKENFPDSAKRFLVKHYLRHFAYRSFPIVGLTPQQIEKYCEWKTDRLNEMILIREGILGYDPNGGDSINHFTTSAYLGRDPGDKKMPIGEGPRNLRMEDGILFPKYRIAEMDEWKFAALAVGDDDHTYLKSPESPGNRKFDKQHYFDHLYGRRSIIPSNMSGLPLWRRDEGPKDVFLTGTNEHRIHGMNDNISELVKTNGKYFVTGGSWRSPWPDHSALYDKTGVNGVWYSFAHEFEQAEWQENHVSAATGFRLAMSCYGCNEGKLEGKRRKVRD